MPAKSNEATQERRSEDRNRNRYFSGRRGNLPVRQSSVEQTRSSSSTTPRIEEYIDLSAQNLPTAEQEDKSEEYEEDPLINPVSYVKEKVNLVNTNKNTRKHEDVSPKMQHSDESKEIEEADDHTVILHSNFYLPEKTTDDDEIESEMAVENVPKEPVHEAKKSDSDNSAPESDYDYYEDYEDEITKPAPIASQEIPTSTAKLDQPKVELNLNAEPKDAFDRPKNGTEDDSILGKL